MKHEQSEKLFVEELYNKSSLKNDEITPIVEVKRLTGDASTRRYYRVLAKGNSFVVCLDNPTDIDSDFLQMQKILNDNKVRVPIIYDDRKDKGYLLEEDLGDVTFLSQLSELDDEQEYQLYKRAIDELIKIHQIDIEENRPYSNRYFDEEKLSQETNMTNEYFLRKYLKCTDENVILQISNKFKEINELLSAERRVVCHRDFHSRNIMLKEKDLIIIDFQDARLGPSQYDLVSLLEDCYYCVAKENKKKLIDYYKGQMKDLVNDSFDEVYDLMLLQRTYKAIGSFCYIAETRKDYRYLKYVGRAFESIRNTMRKYPQMKTLNDILSRLYYES